MNILGLTIIIGSYLIGSISWALIIGKLFYKTDIRNHGSGNLGASNAGRVLGKKAGFCVAALDISKAFICVAICSTLLPQYTPYAGLACCFGHCFPIFANFKGGKAVATSMGYLFGLALFVTDQFIPIFIIPVICFFTILYLTKTVAISSLSSFLIAIVMSIIFIKDISITVSIIILWIFLVYRHKDNIKRILDGKENKITWM
ncbi:MAG: glycerol-3-phosphate 1-O-acyltransferase PlsY [Anaerorhabdus sp.]